MDNLPAGIAERLQRIQDPDDDEIDRSIPSTWGVDNTSNNFRFQTSTARTALSASSAFATPGSTRNWARGLATPRAKEDPYQLSNQNRSFSFSSAVPYTPQMPAWDTGDPHVRDQRQQSRYPQQNLREESSTLSQSSRSTADAFASRNRALEGTFGSESVVRVADEKCGNVASQGDTVTSGFTGNRSASGESQGQLDPRLEDPSLDIDPNVRANFVAIDRLDCARAPRSAIAMSNPTLIASNTNGSISTVIGGEVITYTPKPVDKRVRHLDRHGEYIGENLGAISKRLKRQHKDNIAERDRQMLQATAEYRALAAMSAEERAEFLEHLRKPVLFYGAFEDDQFETEEIPDIYTRQTSSNRIVEWITNESSRASSFARNNRATSSKGLPSTGRENTIGSALLGGFDDLDEIAAGSSYVPLSAPQPRSRKYFQDAFYYSRKPSGRHSASHGSTSTTQAPYPALGLPLFSDSGAGQSLTVSSRSIEDPFTFDDSPELQTPGDTDFELTELLSPEQDRLYQLATDISKKHGRVILVRLNELVKFSPGAIAKRVFGGVIQEMQLFPTQRVAIVVFLHCTEAKAFLRHVSKTYTVGSEQEIRELQIEAGWYKGTKHSSILPMQSHILQHHLSHLATRVLRLHRIPHAKEVADVSAELGMRLAKPLLKVTLRKPQQRYLQLRLGHEAIVEFASIGDAIEARRKLLMRDVFEYEASEPVFATDPASRLGAERKYCDCLGCREQRAAREDGA